MERIGRGCLIAVVFVFAVFVASDSLAQQPAGVRVAAPASDPPPPVEPAVVNRDPTTGRAVVRATRITTPLRIDGRLDEAVYEQVQSISGFVQNDPKEGAPASEKTEVWLLYDRDNIYVVCRCWESQPDRMVGNEMRRDNGNIVQADHISWSIDTFHDRRTGYNFIVNAVGGRLDGQISNDRQLSNDWNPIWDLKTGKFEGGYVVEAAIPFKSLRYPPGESQTWGFQVRRRNNWRNEYSFLNPVPASVGSQGWRPSLQATVVGIQAPPQSKKLDIKPYVTSNVTTDATVRPTVSNDPDWDAGLDLKYGVTQSLTADFTLNTDFAQVEADEQQINLTRFNLSFPEKREFFLENAGTFFFGGATTAGNTGDQPVLFYSRQIGLNNGRNVPIRAGGRFTGRAGRYTIGLLDVQTDDEPLAGAEATNFSVARIRRDILRRSSVGAMFTGRSISANGAGANQAYGVDGAFSFFTDFVINTHWARTQTEDAPSDEDTSYGAQLDYVGDRYGVSAGHLAVGQNFNPGVGFARRLDMRSNSGSFRFSPRPANSKTVRKYSWTGAFNRIANWAGRLETREIRGEFEIQLQNSDRFFSAVTDNYEFLPRPFRIATGVTLPIGGYDFNNARVGYALGQQRNFSGTLTFDQGTFYNGHKTTLAVSGGRINPGPQISIEPGLSINKVDVDQGAFTTKIITTRVTFTMTPLMFTTAFLQYNSGSNTVAANVRFRWEFRPGSEFFIVYNEQRDTLAPEFPALANRAFIVKINRLFRF